MCGRHRCTQGTYLYSIAGSATISASRRGDVPLDVVSMVPTLDSSSVAVLPLLPTFTSVFTLMELVVVTSVTNKSLHESRHDQSDYA